MSISDDLNEIDRILKEAAADQPAIMRTVPRDDPNRAARLLSARREVFAAASARRVDLARSAGFRMFDCQKKMMAALRRQVMLKMIRQAHEAELAEPGAPPTSGIVGTPEW